MIIAREYVRRLLDEAGKPLRGTSQLSDEKRKKLSRWEQTQEEEMLSTHEGWRRRRSQ